VIGSGAGGAPVAAALAEAGLDVVVLESGPRLETADFNGEEADMLQALYRSERTSGGMTFSAGACVGGSTVVNDALCWPVPPEVLAAWRTEAGLTGLSEPAFAPFVERVWRDVHASPTRPGDLDRNARQLARGSARLGWSAGPMHRNVRGCAGLGLCNLGCPTGAKQSMLLTYVPRAERAGARVLHRARAERLEVRDGAVRAVEASRLDGAGRPVGRARVESPRACVAAGVLGTAALLLRSGLSGRAGPTGYGLQAHSSLHVTARFRDEIQGFYGPTMSYAVDAFSDVNGHEGAGFMLENVTASPATTASSLPGFGPEHARAMAALPHLARCAVVLRDRARGSVRLDTDGAPRFDYAPGREDVARLREGMNAAARAYLAAGAEEVWLPVNGLAPIRSEAALRDLGALDLTPRSFSFLYAVHLFGGACMGATRARSTCDEAGRVWDVRGLWVSDAASLPSNTGVNPQITVMANALRIGAGVAETSA
jgi:choline dehydrogenase-like flavoprotein